MAKKIKLNIKNSQLTKALNLKKIKLSAAGKKKSTEPAKEDSSPKKPRARIVPKKEEIKEIPIEVEKTEELKIETPPPKIEEQKEIKVEKQKEVKKEEPKKEIKKEPLKPTIKREKELSITDKKRKLKKDQSYKSFDSRDKLGLRSQEEGRWRKKRKHFKSFSTKTRIPVIRPKQLTIRVPISIKDLASNMKLKASELISKLFAQGIVTTLNDYLEDDTTLGLLGHEFGCEITIDKTKEERLQITNKTIKEEIESTKKQDLKPRAPIITFMGHVDHGKTSIIDAIRKSNIAAGEAGAITQHIGAFRAKTNLGEITILDTPGHEAFTEMRSRGANVTDIVVLVIAGDEGIREQTVEAINQAKEASAPIIVAINKSDKDGFDPEKVYRQLSDHSILPEAWGGDTITINCSALENKGIKELLEMISLQAEVLELKANEKTRARGVVLESQMHKGLGSIATILVLNGTLKLSDPIVFGLNWGRIKTMHDQHGKQIKVAGPSIPAKITGLSNLAEAGEEFVVVKDEKEAKALAAERKKGAIEQRLKKTKKTSLESLTQSEKKELPIILRADMQGSLEALVTAVKKIPSEKVELNIVSAEVGEISESDVELSTASNASIIGFHTRIESHADSLIKENKIKVATYDIIYHAIDAIKVMMVEKLDKIEEEKKTGEALIQTVFQSSQLGKIAGCIVKEGTIKRGQRAKITRNNEIVWTGKIGSLKRVSEDVSKVQKGVECGIILEKHSDIEEKDIIETFDITYTTPKL